MKMLAAALSGAAVAGLFVVMHADSPYFSPRPEEMFSAASGPFQLGQGSSIIVTTVPNDKWLVLTDSGISETNIGDVDIIERDQTGTETLKVPAAIAAYGANTWVPTPAPAAHSPGHGVVFHPGTSVVLKNSNNNGSSSYGYLLVGYYVDK